MIQLSQKHSSLLFYAGARGAAARPGYFFTEDSSLIQLSPVRFSLLVSRILHTHTALFFSHTIYIQRLQDNVMYFAIGFIVIVFILHIIGKVRG